MATQQLNISLPQQLARFIRGKVKNGEYADAGEVIQDAVRRMQAADFESDLSETERRGIARRIKQGIRDIEAGRFNRLDAVGLRRLRAEISTQSARKKARQTG